MTVCVAYGCLNTADKKCARCHSVYYCDTTCQRRDWAQHKRCCKQMSKDDPPPSEATKSLEDEIKEKIRKKFMETKVTEKSEAKRKKFFAKI